MIRISFTSSSTSAPIETNGNEVPVHKSTRLNVKDNRQSEMNWSCDGAESDVTHQAGLGGLGWGGGWWGGGGVRWSEGNFQLWPRRLDSKSAFH